LGLKNGSLGSYDLDTYTNTSKEPRTRASAKVTREGRPASRKYSTEELEAQVAGPSGGRRCIALQVRHIDGTPAMLLMGDSCAECRTFRAGMPVRPVTPPPSSVPTDTDDTLLDDLERPRKPSSSAWPD
jgi:hypothetical protein